MDDYKDLDELLNYSAENEYAGIDDEKSNTEIHNEPAQTQPEAPDNKEENAEDAIPYYTPSQYAPTPVEEQAPHTEEPQEVYAPQITPESTQLIPDNAKQQAETPAPAQPQQPVQPRTPYAQPVYPQQPVQYYQQPYRQPVQPQQPYRQPAQPQQPYRQPVQPQQPYRQPAQPQQPYRQPVQPQQLYRQPAQPQQPYRQPVQPQQPYRQPVQPQQPYRQPAQPQPVNMNYNPYATQQPVYQGVPYQQPEKPKTSAGTKAFIAILLGLLFVMVIAFGVYIAMNANSKQKQPDNPIPTEFSDIFDNDNGNNNGFGFDSVQSTEFEAEIELIADNGETQQRDSDNPVSVGTPDENAKRIELKPLPSDKDDAKYTTQYSFDTVSPSVVYVAIYEDEITDDQSTLLGQGTGTVISSDGYIITNAHVIGNSKHYLVQVSLNSEETYQAKIVGFDNWTDIAVLKIDANNLTPVTFGDSDLIEIGQDVIAIGNAGGTFKNSLTKGVVSAVNRELAINKNVKYIQSDAAINPGNSGGPLCNLYGQVIGITSAKISSNVYESMSFSIPSKTVQEIASDLMRYGYVKGRVRMGFSGTEITQEDMYYYQVPAGILISEIADDSPLKKTDIKENDIITAVDGIEITSFQDIYDILSDHKPGDKITLTVYRQE